MPPLPPPSHLTLVAPFLLIKDMPSLFYDSVYNYKLRGRILLNNTINETSTVGSCVKASYVLDTAKHIVFNVGTVCGLRFNGHQFRKSSSKICCGKLNKHDGCLLSE